MNSSMKKENQAKEENVRPKGWAGMGNKPKKQHSEFDC